jgi:hypothetical protein
MTTLNEPVGIDFDLASIVSTHYPRSGPF